MRLLLLLLILNIPILLIGQKWKPAEWITADGQRSTGKVKIPTFIWGSSHYIDLKKEGTIKTIIGTDVVFLRLLERQNDTLIISSLFNERHHKLQKIIKGEPSLYFEMDSKSDHYFLFRNGSFEHWDRTDIREDLTEVFNIYSDSFSQKTMIYNTDIVRRLIRKLNKPSVEELPLEEAFQKWRYSLTYFLPVIYDYDYYGTLFPKDVYHFNIGIERSFISIPFLSVNTQLSYNSSHLNGFSRIGSIIYQKELKISFLKVINTLKLEFFPRKRLSPFVSSGFILSIPTEFKRTFITSSSYSTLGGLPSRHITKATFLPEGGKLVTLGIRFHLSPKTRLNVMIQMERFKKHVDFSSFNEPFLNLKDSRKTTPDEDLIGISLTHSF